MYIPFPNHIPRLGLIPFSQCVVLLRHSVVTRYNSWEVTRHTSIIQNILRLRHVTHSLLFLLVSRHVLTMRLLSPLVFLTGILSVNVLAQDASDIPKQKHNYEVCGLATLYTEFCLTSLCKSDVTRLRKIVINRQAPTSFFKKRCLLTRSPLVFTLTGLCQYNIS